MSFRRSGVRRSRVEFQPPSTIRVRRQTLQSLWGSAFASGANTGQLVQEPEGSLDHQHPKRKENKYHISYIMFIICYYYYYYPNPRALPRLTSHGIEASPPAPALHNDNDDDNDNNNNNNDNDNSKYYCYYH